MRLNAKKNLPHLSASITEGVLQDRNEHFAQAKKFWKLWPQLLSLPSFFSVCLCISPPSSGCTHICIWMILESSTGE